MNHIILTPVVLLLLLLGFGIRLLYRRLNRAWLITLGMAVVTGIVWISSADQYRYNNEGEFVLAVLSTALFAGLVLGEIAVQLLRYRKKKKSTEKPSKGEPT
ncbi:MAG: hypothetical protein IJP32_09080 [Clostridia bacterium]|nr:hypothetical protein [Clostridia bacterium]